MPSAERPSQTRLFSLDLWRFNALLFMVIFHFSYDLNILKIVTIDMRSFFWFWFPRLIVFMFLFASGCSFTLVYGEHLNSKKFFKRWRQIFLGALLVSASTYFMYPKNWVYFGILHCISCSLLLAIPLRRRPRLIIFIIAAIALSAWYFQITFKKLSSFVPIKSVDFIPLYPWFAIFLLGMLLGPRLFTWSEGLLPKNRRWHFVEWCSRRSLTIYIVHQPLLFGMLLLYKKLF